MDRIEQLESRLAATDARLTALASGVARVVGALREYDCALDHPLRGLDGVEPTIACDDDLAALRAPGDEATLTPEQFTPGEGLRAAAERVIRVYDAGLPSNHLWCAVNRGLRHALTTTEPNAALATARRERDEAVKQSERFARAADVWSEANWRMVLALNEAGCAREANGHTIMPEDRIRTLARERDEAAGVLRAMIQWQADMEREEEPVLFDSIIARARALVTGEAGPSKLDALMTEREADLIGESFAAERELRAEIETCRETISRQRAMIAEAQGEGAREALREVYESVGQGERYETFAAKLIAARVLAKVAGEDTDKVTHSMRQRWRPSGCVGQSLDQRAGSP